MYNLDCSYIIALYDIAGQCMLCSVVQLIVFLPIVFIIIFGKFSISVLSESHVAVSSDARRLCSTNAAQLSMKC